jgi:L-amino acid N-acyltransferase
VDLHLRTLGCVRNCPLHGSHDAMVVDNPARLLPSHFPLIRPAGEADLPEILAIYNDIIASTTAVYSLEPVALANRVTWFSERTGAGYPVLVAEVEKRVAGFASFAEFRGLWPGYRYSVEHTVHVCSDMRGVGIGTGLVSALIPLAARLGKHVMLGAIDATNEASIRMHARLGFEPSAHLREVGRKFGRWLDLILMQRLIDAPGALRED